MPSPGLAKELARIAYRVLVDECDYNGTFKGVPIEKPKAASGLVERARSHNWPRSGSKLRSSPFKRMGRSAGEPLSDLGPLIEG